MLHRREEERDLGTTHRGQEIGARREGTLSAVFGIFGGGRQERRRGRGRGRENRGTKEGARRDTTERRESDSMGDRVERGREGTDDGDECSYSRPFGGQAMLASDAYDRV